MKIAFIMDPLGNVKAYKDTTYFIMLAAQERGHKVFYLDQDHLFTRKAELFAHVTPVTVSKDESRPFTTEEPRLVNMAEMDVVFVRTDPPFDRRYFYTTLFLDLLPPTTRVVNRPDGLRNWNEKLAALFFPEFTPDTLVSSDTEQIKAFMRDVGGHVTLKPIDGFGGHDIVFLKEGDINTDQLIAFQTRHGSHKVIAQAYLPAAKEGDKRILLLDGEVLGAILRLHSEGKELNNLDAGGTAHHVELTDFERDLCRKMKPQLLAQGVYFCGIDVIGDSLIEVNVTSPTGLRQMADFTGQPLHHRVIEGLEEKRQEIRFKRQV